jgi:hypothetical protein
MDDREPRFLTEQEIAELREDFRKSAELVRRHYRMRRLLVDDDAPKCSKTFKRRTR